MTENQEEDSSEPQTSLSRKSLRFQTPMVPFICLSCTAEFEADAKRVPSQENVIGLLIDSEPPRCDDNLKRKSDSLESAGGEVTLIIIIVLAMKSQVEVDSRVEMYIWEVWAENVGILAGFSIVDADMIGIS